MTDLPSNSYTSKNNASNEEPMIPEKKVTQVANGKVSKSSWIRNATKDIANETTGTSIVKEAVVPAVRKGIYDILSNIVDMIFGGGKYTSHTGGIEKVSYQKYYDRNSRQDNSKPRSRASYGFSYQDPIVESRSQAEMVCDQMQSLLDRYHVVSIQDLYEACGIRGEYTNNNYGWEDLRDMEIVKVQDGWLIRMPKCNPIN